MACSRCIMLRNDIRVHALTKSLFAFIFNHIHYSENLQLDTLMLLLNREGSFRTEGAPMESCRPAIIVSFGVTAHWLPQKGDREAGIDSVAEFRVWCSMVIHDSKHFARSPSKRGTGR